MTDQRPQSSPPIDTPSDAPVPKVVVSRLSLYLRELKLRARDGSATISSR